VHAARAGGVSASRADVACRGACMCSLPRTESEFRVC
jgi:hypothetical protein